MENISLSTQKTYNVLLQSMAHPGRIYRLPGEYNNNISSSDYAESGHGKAGALMSVLLTLLDYEVTFFFIGSGSCHMEAKIFELTRSTVSDISSADFIIVPDGRSRGELLKAKRGSLDYPDMGATVIYMVGSLDDSSNGKSHVVLKGPGVKDKLKIFIGGLQKDEFFWIKDVNAEFPLGIDCIFIDKPGRIMCIPRSTIIEVN